MEDGYLAPSRGMMVNETDRSLEARFLPLACPGGSRGWGLVFRRSRRWGKWIYRILGAVGEQCPQPRAEQVFRPIHDKHGVCERGDHCVDGDGGDDYYEGEGGRGRENDFKIDEISIQSFSLSPGKGGHGDNIYAGGGGGLLIDNDGPETSAQEEGEGYGGGSGSPGQGCNLGPHSRGGIHS